MCRRYGYQWLSRQQSGISLLDSKLVDRQSRLARTVETVFQPHTKDPLPVLEPVRCICNQCRRYKVFQYQNAIRQSYIPYVSAKKSRRGLFQSPVFDEFQQVPEFRRTFQLHSRFIQLPFFRTQTKDIYFLIQHL